MTSGGKGQRRRRRKMGGQERSRGLAPIGCCGINAPGDIGLRQLGMTAPDHSDTAAICH